MLTEEGIVVEVNENRVLVRPQRSDRCEGCSPEFCFPDGGGGLMIEARDPLGVKAGQRIRLAIRPQSLFWYSFLLYGVPLLGLLVGAFSGSRIATALGWGDRSDILAVAMGLGLTALSFLRVRRYIQKQDREQTYRPIVIEILDGKC